jgi:hypothetical protein
MAKRDRIRGKCDKELPRTPGIADITRFASDIREIVHTTNDNIFSPGSQRECEDGLQST